MYLSHAALRILAAGMVVAAAGMLPARAQQLPDPLAPKPLGNTLTGVGVSPSVQVLFDLEAKFQRAVLQGGGPAFAAFFADDGVTIGNKQDVTRGQVAISAKAKWTPSEYLLTWTPQGGQMGPAGDMGFTWGHYEARSHGKDGKPVTETGRYMTIWKKQADGTWKVAMDASNEEPPNACLCTDDEKTPAPAAKP